MCHVWLPALKVMVNHVCQSQRHCVRLRWRERCSRRRRRQQSAAQILHQGDHRTGRQVIRVRQREPETLVLDISVRVLQQSKSLRCQERWHVRHRLHMFRADRLRVIQESISPILRSEMYLPGLDNSGHAFGNSLCPGTSQESFVVCLISAKGIPLHKQK